MRTLLHAPLIASRLELIVAVLIVINGALIFLLSLLARVPLTARTAIAVIVPTAIGVVLLSTFVLDAKLTLWSVLITGALVVGLVYISTSA